MNKVVNLQEYKKEWMSNSWILQWENPQDLAVNTTEEVLKLSSFWGFTQTVKELLWINWTTDFSWLVTNLSQYRDRLNKITDWQTQADDYNKEEAA